ncbi:helix-turn-helix transcriptional regulator [Staphylococcus hominis]
MNKVVGYRNMLGKSQEKMAKEFNISSQSYRLKEKGQVNFNKNEMIKFRDLLRENLFPNITIDEIFFLIISLCLTMF